jgi:transposase
MSSKGLAVSMMKSASLPEASTPFLAQIVMSQPAGREIHVMAGNLSAHKTKIVFEFLEANPTVRIHYTPTYSSWLNQVEIWFSKIQRDVGVPVAR